MLQYNEVHITIHSTFSQVSINSVTQHYRPQTIFLWEEFYSCVSWRQTILDSCAKIKNHKHAQHQTLWCSMITSTTPITSTSSLVNVSCVLDASAAVCFNDDDNCTSWHNNNKRKTWSFSVNLSDRSFSYHYQWRHITPSTILQTSIDKHTLWLNSPQCSRPCS